MVMLYYIIICHSNTRAVKIKCPELKKITLATSHFLNWFWQIFTLYFHEVLDVKILELPYDACGRSWGWRVNRLSSSREGTGNACTWPWVLKVYHLNKAEHLWRQHWRKRSSEDTGGDWQCIVDKFICHSMDGVFVCYSFNCPPSSRKWLWRKHLMMFCSHPLWLLKESYSV